MLYDLAYIPVVVLLATAMVQVIRQDLSKISLQVGLALSLLGALFFNEFEQIYLVIASIFLLLYTLYNKSYYSSEGLVHLTLTCLWAFSFYCAQTPFMQALCLMGFIVNALFYRQIYHVKRGQIQQNMVFILYCAPMVFYVLFNRFSGEQIYTGDMSSAALGMVLLFLVLIAYYYLQFFVLPKSDEYSFTYSVITLVLMTLMIVKLIMDYNIYSIGTFEAPYRLRYLLWVLFLSSLLLPLFKIWRGDKQDKFFALMHLCLFTSLLLFLQNQTSIYVNFAQLSLAILFVFIFYMCAQVGQAISKDTQSLLYILAVFLFFLPLNYALDSILQGILSQQGFWLSRPEILFFPTYFSLIPLGLAFTYAVVLGSDLLMDFKISKIKRSTVLNFPSLLSLFIFVLGIYPFPLYIYIQFIMDL